jgi:hypothetical protein
MRDNPEDAAGVREGDILAGKYRIEKVLGIGGMGVVVAARHLQLETRVAIKFLLPTMLASKEAVGRFAREARAAVKITGEHVARVLDVGTLDTGAPFMVMEFLEGSDLSNWLQQRGALPIDQAVEFLLYACVAVAEAHSLGIVHRDLKPANLFCIRRADGKASIKVLDFGISKVTEPTASAGGMSMTKTNAMMGSPLYMSPEQMRLPKEADAQTDIWALGVILYELLTGRVPFGGETVAEVVLQVATEPPSSLRGLRPDVPPGLEAVVLRCLEKAKQARYRNTAELALALAEYAPSRAKASVDRICGILQVPAPASNAPPGLQPPLLEEPTVAAGTMTAVGRTTAGIGGGRKKRVAALGILLGVMGVVALSAFVINRPAKREVRASAASLAPPGITTLSAAISAPPVAAGAASDNGAQIVPLASEQPVALVPRKSAPINRPRGPSGHPGAAALAAAAASTATSPSAAPSPAPPPTHGAHNQLDLGSFQ